jgi:hypothetical protein
MRLQDFTDEQHDRVQAVKNRRLERQQDLSAYREGQNAAGIAAQPITTGAFRSGDPVLLNTDGAIVQQEWARSSPQRRVVAPAARRGNVQVFLSWRIAAGTRKFGWGGITGKLNEIPLQIPASEQVIDFSVNKFGNGLDDWILTVSVRVGTGADYEVKIYTIKGGQEQPTTNQSYNNRTLRHSGSGFWASVSDFYIESLNGLVVEQDEEVRSGPYAAGRFYSDATFCVVLGGALSFSEYCVTGLIGPGNSTRYSNTSRDTIRSRSANTALNSSLTKIASSLGLNRSYREERHDVSQSGWIGNPPGGNFNSIPYGQFCVGDAPPLVIYEGQHQSSASYSFKEEEKIDRGRLASWLGSSALGIAESQILFTDIGQLLERGPSGSVKTYNSACVTEFGDTKLVPIFSNFINTGAEDPGETYNNSVETRITKNAFPAWLAPNVFHDGFSTTNSTRIRTGVSSVFNTTYSADIRYPVACYDDGRSYCYDRTIRPDPSQNTFEEKRYVSGRGQVREISGSDISYSKWLIEFNRQFIFEENWKIRKLNFDETGREYQDGGKFTVETIVSIGGAPFMEGPEIKAFAREIPIPDSQFGYPADPLGSFYIE